jgi:hypothetical protein
MRMHKSVVRGVLIVLLVVLALTTLFGALLVVPMLPLEWLSGTAFRDYRLPAVALGTIGAGAIVSVALLALHRPAGTVLAAIVGAAMAIFELVETLVVWTCGYTNWASGRCRTRAARLSQQPTWAPCSGFPSHCGCSRSTSCTG